MSEIIVRTQSEIDALPDEFDVYTIVKIQCSDSWVTISKNPKNSTVEARESSHVVARESSHVVARESSHVVARESSHVVAWESSHVVALESSHVEARGSSHVEAWGHVCVHLKSDRATVVLLWLAVCFAIARGKIIRKSSYATVIQQKPVVDNTDWMDRSGVECKDGRLILYKRISKDWRTQENTDRETTWVVGEVKEHPCWNPATEECGSGKFHGCSVPYLCDDFRDAVGDRYIALSVHRDDIYAWPGLAVYPNKIAFRMCIVLYECDRYGERIVAE